MARISLLLSLAFTLSLGLLFLSVSSHITPVPLIPKTVSELQTLPFAKITEILNHKEKFSLKTTKIKTMFIMCKGYVEYLESLYKSANRNVDFLGITKTKYTLTTKAILAVQASIVGKVDKKTSLKLMKSCAGFTKGFLHIQKAILKISAKHNYKADANINFRESRKISDAVLYFRNSINDFMDIVNDFEERKLKKVVQHVRTLRQVEGEGTVISHERELTKETAENTTTEKANGSDQSKYDKYSQFFGSFLEGKQHGRELTEKQAENNTTEKVNGSDQSKYDKYFQFFGSFFDGKQHGRELIEVQADRKVNSFYEKFAKYVPYLGDKAHKRKLLEDQAGTNTGAHQAGGKVNNLYEEFIKYMPYLGGKYNGRKLLEDQAGVNAEAHGNREFKSLFKDFFNFNVGEKVQKDAAGKMKVAGKMDSGH